MRSQFRHSLDLGTKIWQAVALLENWGLLEPVAGGFKATPVGALAANSEFDLLLLRTAKDRVLKMKKRPSPQELAVWIIEDYIADEKKRDRWLNAIGPWLDEVDERSIAMPEKFRGDFENGLERLSRLASLHGEIARSLGKKETSEACSIARGCILYGVAPELIPLISLRIPQLGRARCRFLYEERGIKNLEDLANSDSEQLKGPHAPVTLTRRWVELAKGMWKAGEPLIQGDKKSQDRTVDDFLADFKVDQLALFGPDGLIGESM